VSGDRFGERNGVVMISPLSPQRSVDAEKRSTSGSEDTCPSKVWLVGVPRRLEGKFTTPIRGKSLGVREGSKEGFSCAAKPWASRRSCPVPAAGRRRPGD
jgi:hypothetical protein